MAGAPVFPQGGRQLSMPDAPRGGRYDARLMTTLATPRSEPAALIALFAGALAIGSSGIFVRLSETGPTATAFWRGAFALPFLALWAWLERRAQPQAAPVLREP